MGRIGRGSVDSRYFPTLEAARLTHAVELPAWKLRRLIVRTEFAADEHPIRYALGGSAFEFADGTLHCIATDGRGIAHAFEHAAGAGLVAPETIRVGGDLRPLAPVVPCRALNALAALLETSEYLRLTLGFTADGRFQVRTSELLFVARLLEGQFPAGKEVFPRPSETVLRVTNPKRLLRALKVAGSLKMGTVGATELVRGPQGGGRPSTLGRAIGEVGRVAKTLYLLNYLDDEAYRRRILTQLNRGESRHGVARAIFHGQRGELRQRYREGQEDQLGALGLAVNAVVLWNTRYLDAALSQARAAGVAVHPEDVERLSPLLLDHVNVLGRYEFVVTKSVRQGRLRPLRDPGKADDLAA